MAKVNKNPFTKLLVQLAIAHKTFAMRTLGTTSHWIWDPLVFHTIAEGVSDGDAGWFAFTIGRARNVLTLLSG
jgi:hypothetical protein